MWKSLRRIDPVETRKDATIKMFHELTNHLWQSTLFAAAAGLLTLAFRKNRAAVRYWLWLSASIKFLIPFSLLLSLGSHLDRAPAAHLVPTRVTPPALSLQISEPFLNDSPSTRYAAKTTDWRGLAITCLWIGGFGVILLMRFRAWLDVRSAVRSSVPIDVPVSVEVRSTPGLLEPGVVGLLRPVLFLPAGIADRLTPLQLEAVLAHELCHVRRRDNLLAAIHMIVEAVFWFHPLVWWIGARLMEERERACDEDVLRLGSAPHVYAEGILNVCKLYVESPLVCVSGVTGADLKRRIRDILNGSAHINLSAAKKAALAVAAAGALAAPIVVGVMNAPYIRAQSAAAGRPQFEVASIKACGARDVAIPGGGGRGDGKGARSGGGPTQSPGALYLPCLPMFFHIRMAYIQFADGQNNIAGTRAPKIEGLPSWAESDSELYSITAKAEGNASQLMMRGPMLQTLLEDRLKLKLRHDTREVPVFELVVAKGGLKMTPTPPDSCTPRDPNQVSTQPEPGKHMCDTIGGRISESRRTVEGFGSTIERLTVVLGNISGRPVIDKTGVKGRFDFSFELPRSEDAPATEPPPPGAPPGFIPMSQFAPALGPALAQYGLKLQPAKGPVEFLVIDRIEKPSEN
jgi:bla regulator protein BlaR1